MPNNKLNVLITRPAIEGRVLANTLKKMGAHTHCQPMFDYQLNNTPENLSHLFSQVKHPIFIFISVASVTHANSILPINTWPVSKIIAVGSATSKALNALNINTITPTLHTSEGVLSLADLKSVDGQDVVIVRGDGGREHLAESLKSRKAIVYYFESYRRIWRQINSDVVQFWRSNNVNCIVITSDALLQSVVQLINLSDSHVDNHSNSYWFTTCCWVVASERIAQNAKSIGLLNVVNANGASDKAISAAISTVITSDVIINTEEDDDR